MFSLIRNCSKNNNSFCQFAKLFCTKTDVEVKGSLTNQQNDKLLETLNESSPEELSKYNISLPHIQRLTNWKSRKGPFRNLSEVLEVDGIGEGILKEIGASITGLNTFEEVQTVKLKQYKKMKHLVVPDMDYNTLSTLNSAVAIHLEPTGIGWAKLEKHDNMLTRWECDSFSSLPQKMLPLDNFNLALSILRKTPPGDVYIFETINGLGLQAQQKPIAVSAYNQKMELMSMLLALINTSVFHNPSLQKLDAQEPLRKVLNRVFFLKPNIPARLFGTLIGSEKVSTVTAINGILKDDYHMQKSLPYTPVIFQDNIQYSLSNKIPALKELMAQALILAVSFMDLCVRRRALSLEALNNNSRRKRKATS